MDVTFKTSPTTSTLAVICHESDALTGEAETLNAAQNGALSKAAASARFKAKPGEIVDILGLSGDKHDRIILLGAGECEKADARVWEKVGASLVKKMLVSGESEIDVTGVPDASAAASIKLGAALAAYRFDDYREVKDDQKPTLTSFGIVVSDVAAAETASIVASADAFGTNLARDLMNMPPNDLYPESYANKIKELSDLGLEIDVLNESEMEKLGMHALLGVGQGSENHSRMVVMKWLGGADKSAAPLALVGKGVTFDTGGISLKPGPGMEDMKGDMGGSAAVVGAMAALAMRKAKANVIGLVGLVENMPDGKAQRPGDVVESLSGKTIEVLNTDAEGRLILADALTYAQRQGCNRLVDAATLTGSVVVALGHERGGVFSNDEEWQSLLLASAERAGEKMWAMPMDDDYKEQVKSNIADLQNIGTRWGGSITAAIFLKAFADPTPWIHLDIAGTAWFASEKPHMPKGPTGVAVRTLVDLAMGL